MSDHPVKRCVSAELPISATATTLYINYIQLYLFHILIRWKHYYFVCLLPVSLYHMLQMLVRTSFSVYASLRTARYECSSNRRAWLETYPKFDSTNVHTDIIGNWAGTFTSVSGVNSGGTGACDPQQYSIYYGMHSQSSIMESFEQHHHESTRVTYSFRVVLRINTLYRFKL